MEGMGTRKEVKWERREGMELRGWKQTRKDERQINKIEIKKIRKAGKDSTKFRMQRGTMRGMRQGRSEVRKD